MSANMDLWRAVKRDQGVRFYWTRCGFPRRSFLSQSDAQAFDNGWDSADPMQPIPEQWGPFKDGWLARLCEDDEDQTTRDDQRADEVEDA